MSCLTDKTKEVRNIAEKVLEMTISDVGIEVYRLAIKDLKPAFIQMVTPILLKYEDDHDDLGASQISTLNLTGGSKAGGEKKLSERRKAVMPDFPQNIALNT